MRIPGAAIHGVRAFTLRLAALGIVLLMPACGSEPDALVTSATADTLASGRVVVTNSPQGQWTEDSAWSLVEELRLGCVEGCGAELLSDVAYLLTDESTGDLYVLEYQSQEVRVFDAEGAHLRTLGGLGDGPGELRSAAGLDWGPEGNLWVWGAQRYQALDVLGNELARHLRQVRGIVYPWMGGFTPDGRYIDFGVQIDQAGFDENRRPILTGDGRVTVSALHPASGDIDTLPEIRFPADVTDDGQLKQSFRSFVGIQDGSGDLWFALTDPYLVHRRSLDGDTLLSFSRPSNPEPISTATMDSIIAERARSGFPGPDLEREDWATHHQLVTNVLVDGAGHVFVLPREIGIPLGSAMDVFTEDGHYLGRMTFPEPVVVDEPSPHITDSHVYAVVENELGIPFVVRYRIERP